MPAGLGQRVIKNTHFLFIKSTSASLRMTGLCIYFLKKSICYNNKRYYLHIQSL